MSSARLSKKIQAAPEGAYGNLLESFVSVGTPLPSLADTGKGKGKDANEFKPLWQQEVVDEQGRRRLHGAFTGGFSAGYFNTVGSKEGQSLRRGLRWMIELTSGSAQDGHRRPSNLRVTLGPTRMARVLLTLQRLIWTPK